MKIVKIITTIVVFALFGMNQASAQKNITLRSHMTFPGKQLSNIGGYVDSLGNEYALVGHSEGMSIVNVQDPDNPFIVQEIPGPNSIWREVKVWQKYAYVTTEGGSQGLTVVDLSNLPGTNIPYQNWAPVITTGVGTYTLSTIHALHIDNGYVYLYGANNGSGIDGIVIADLTDPWNPTVAGLYNGYYVHDGYVRNDTVWACHIYDGFFSAIDVTDKTNPVQLVQQNTPNNFSHNSWLSDNSQYLYTTDEVDNSYLAAYDVSDVSNITFVDKVQSQNGGSNSVVHNTHILNDYAVTSWYKDGVVITDAHRPQNLVNVGWFDTSPLSGGGYEGCWGVYPFLPSGTIVASDMQEGLYVLTPDYIRACYLEGNIVDSICGAPIAGVKVTIVGGGALDSTNALGEYKTGTPDAGTYTVTFQKAGYNTVTINNVVLDHTVITSLNVQMISTQSVSLNGNVSSNTGNPIANIPVSISNSNFAYSYTSDPNGNFFQCGLIGGNYDIYAGAWGYVTYCNNANLSNGNLNISLQNGIYDDFALNYNWNVSGTASVGVWTRAIPAITMQGSFISNPGTDASSDCGGMAFVTGNNNAAVGADDLDDGYSILTSPVFDLTNVTNPHIKYARWFYNGGGAGSVNDSLIIKISNGTQTAILEVVTAGLGSMSAWVEKDILLTNNIIPLTNSMQVIVYAVDAAPGHLVEAGFDHFRVEPDTINTVAKSNFNKILGIYPNPLINTRTLFFNKSEASFDLISLTDITGRIIEQFDITSNQGSIKLADDLAKGTYMINMYKKGAKQWGQQLVIIE
ncbi:MAG TPA: choice-of-anchor B family protein [Bacteroidia bacterium]|nr:choice-of-anchor B family protein [Bacteroidia bacterium]